MYVRSVAGVVLVPRDGPCGVGAGAGAGAEAGAEGRVVACGGGREADCFGGSGWGVSAVGACTPAVFTALSCVDFLAVVNVSILSKSRTTSPLNIFPHSVRHKNLIFSSCPSVSGAKAESIA